MKYDDPIIIQENEVHSMMLKKIKNGSKVLEFGSASGRMTSILKKQYQCDVYIVEYEKKAYEQAINYAVEGLCCDIEFFEWKKWKNEKFDYIIFSDVLEHLKNPGIVLKETYDMLKEDGSVLVSIPNVAHNDIWIKLYNNTFDYTDIGLLDDTHVHLFAEKSLESFVNDAGFYIYSKQYKTVLTGMTEQCRKNKLEIPNNMYSLLRERENGEVYQFVLELKRNNKIIDGIEFDKVIFSNVHGLIYFDRGQGFSQDDTEDIIGYHISEQFYKYTYNIDITDNIKKIRFDPVENQKCSISDIKCNVSNNTIPYLIRHKDARIIISNDPQVIWDISEGTKTFCLEIIVDLKKENVENVLVEYYETLNKNIELLDQKYCLENEELNKIIDNLKYEYSVTINSLDKCNELINIKDSQIEEKDAKLRETIENKNVILSQKELLEVQNNEWKEKSKEWEIQNNEWKEKSKEWEIRDREWQEKSKEWEIQNNEWKEKSKEWEIRDREWQEKSKEWENENNIYKERIVLLEEKSRAWEERCIKMESTISWKITKILRIFGKVLKINNK